MVVLQDVLGTHSTKRAESSKKHTSGRLRRRWRVKFAWRRTRFRRREDKHNNPHKKRAILKWKYIQRQIKRNITLQLSRPEESDATGRIAVGCDIKDSGTSARDSLLALSRPARLDKNARVYPSRKLPCLSRQGYLQDVLCWSVVEGYLGYPYIQLITQLFSSTYTDQTFSVSDLKNFVLLRNTQQEPFARTTRSEVSP